MWNIFQWIQSIADLYVFCKLEQINHGASGNLQTERETQWGRTTLQKDFPQQHGILTVSLVIGDPIM